MRRLHIFTLICVTLLCSCINFGEKASINDLQLVSGISDQMLMLDGAEGSTNTFSFRSKHDWQIIDYRGFNCNPSSGAKCGDNEVITVTTTTLQANNSGDTVRLSNLNFKLLSTRFVGISAHQLPQVIVKDRAISINAVEGSIATARIISKADDIELITTGDITASIGPKSSRNERLITIKATTNNTTAKDLLLGTVGFKIDGVKQGGKIDVTQLSAIIFDRSLIMLPGEANRSNMFEIDSDFELEYVSTSSNFTITKMGTNSFKVTSNTKNDSDKVIELGTIEFYIKDTPDCRSSIKVCQRKAVAPQTIIVQFVGTSLKDPYFSTNITRMIDALSKNIQGESQVMVLTTDSTTDGTLYELRYDATLGRAVKEKIEEFELTTPYDAALFESNIRRALEFAPARKYALVIGSHGLAWIPKDIPSVQSLGIKKLGFDPSKLWERNKDAEMTRHIGDSGITIRYNIDEIASAIAANNIKFDYILFDACFMGNIESMYELRNSANYIIGSPCEVMGYGFPYLKIMPHMLKDGGESYDLDAICKDYVEYYRTEAVTNSACVSLTNTSELEALAAVTKRVNEAEKNRDFSLDNVQYYEGQSIHSFYDLGDIVEQSCADKDAVAAFKAQFDKTVTSRYHTKQFYSAYGNGSKHYHDINYYSGLSTSAYVEHYEYDWQQTAWYKATH